MTKTVKFRIVVEIYADAEIDTELTVEQWNALTDVERHQHYREAWDNLAEYDNGGVKVLTAGALQI